MTEKFERIVKVSPAFDKRDANPAKNYGIGSCRITFILKGELGAIQFVISTDWYVQSAREHLKRFPPRHSGKPDGWDVGYHSPKPMYEGQSVQVSDCDLVGGPCHYDGSSCLADEWVEDFVAGGTEWLWPKMEAEYGERFAPREVVTP